MSEILTLLLTVLAQIIPSLNVPSSISAIVSTLVSLIPVLIKEYQDMVPIVRNIIAALKENSTITAEQLQQLDELEAKIDAEFEAAAAMPDEEGMPQ